MKISKILFIVFVLILINACSKDKSDYFDYTKTSSVTTKSVKGFIDLQKLSTEEVGLTFKKDSEIPYSKIVISASYGKSGNIVNVGEASGESGTYNAKVSDVLSKLKINQDSVKVGDVLIFYFDLTTESNVSRDRDVVVLPFSCVSQLAGTYKSVTSGTSTDDCCKANPTNNFESQVVLTLLSDGKYQISDFSAGLYLHWYSVYGISSNEQSPGKIQDICGNLTFYDTTEPFNTAITGSGKVSSDGKVITYSWKNGYDDQGTVTLTKQ